jgi:hypothetical protein
MFKENVFRSPCLRILVSKISCLVYIYIMFSVCDTWMDGLWKCSAKNIVR